MFHPAKFGRIELQFLGNEVLSDAKLLTNLSEGCTNLNPVFSAYLCLHFLHSGRIGIDSQQLSL